MLLVKYLLRHQPPVGLPPLLLEVVRHKRKPIQVGVNSNSFSNLYNKINLEHKDLQKE
jgi:hypothetical protein